MIDWEHIRDIAQAALDGKVIQERRVAGDGRDYGWSDWSHIPLFGSEYYEYRIKPDEPREVWMYPGLSDVWLDNNPPTEREIETLGLTKFREVIE